MCPIVRKNYDSFAADARALLGSGGVLSEAETAPLLVDYRGEWRGRCLLAARPVSVRAAQNFVRLCLRRNVAVVPQGGNTGLAAGATPLCKKPAALVCMERINRIRKVDAENFVMEAEAGCRLETLRDAAEKVRRRFGVLHGAMSRAQLGGALGANSGGLNVLRYGSSRDQALGLEVILPNGELWRGLRALRKNNAGFDLKHLFIGGEGTLGLITAAAVRLHPLPRQSRSALLALRSLHAALQLLPLALEKTDGALSAFEILPGAPLRRAFALWGGGFPLAAAPQWCAMLRVECNADAAQKLRAVYAAARAKNLASGGAFTSDKKTDANWWRLRGRFSELQAAMGAHFSLDISAPVAKVPAFIEQSRRAVARALPGARTLAFGHLGDGNVHFVTAQPPHMTAAAFLARRKKICGVLYNIAWRLGGSICAEHGVGRARRDEMARQIPPPELAAMRLIKKALDPKDIFNPEKVLPPSRARGGL